MTEKELEELEIYLENEDNNEIYFELLNTDYKGLFEPLEFFRLFYSQLDFIKDNKEKALLVIQTLKNLNLNIKQKIVFLEYILWFLNCDENNDLHSKICRRELKKLIDELREENIKAELSKENIKFEALLKHLDTLPNNRDKIAYLNKAKTEYRKTKTVWEDLSGETFDKRCESEIKKLKKLSSLAFSNATNQQKISNDEKRQKDKDLTLDRAVLLFNYLLNYAKVNAHNTDKAEFISFLTGFSKNTVVQKLSRLYEKADLNFIAYEKDMEIVRNYFEKLNLSEITKAIDNDLGT